MKTVLMVVAPLNFRDEEYQIPRNIFDKQEIVVKIASWQYGTAKGINGTEVLVDYLINEVNVESFSAIVLIGGQGMADLIDDQEVQQLAIRFNEAGKIVSAICIAPAILAKAGLLANRQATVWSGAREVFINNKVFYTGKDVEVDGNFITADGPESAEKFAWQIVNSL